MITVSEQLVERCFQTRYEDLPSDVVEKVKSHFIDCLGIALASTNTDFGESIRKTVAKLGRGEDASVIGYGDQLPATSAALANGTLIHGLDYDDTHIAGIVHASAPVIAAALAVCERENIDGEDFITAVAGGLEAVTRLGILAKGKLHDRGFHPTSVFGTFAASLTVGMLLKLNKEQMVSALGLCGSMASGILEVNGSWLKRMHPGWAAHAGIIAAEMARDGFVGPAQVLEGPKGLFASHLSEVPDGLKSLANDWGSRWELKNIAIKRYPCCHFTHAFIDCAKELKDNHKFKLQDIQRIECKTSERVVPIVFEPREVKVKPQLVYDALFSVQYVIAAMLVTGKVDLATFYDERIDDPNILEISQKVFWHKDPHSTYPTHFPGEVSIVLKNGETIRHRVDILRGEPENPIDRLEIEEKFISNATRVISQEQAQKICQAIHDLEHGTIKKLTKLLRIGEVQEN